MKKFLTIFGTRPEAIKMVPVVRKMSACTEIDHRLAVTAQHREMLDQVLSLYEISPEYDFNLMSQNQTLNDLSIKIMSSIEKVLKEYQPDIVLVHGDTTTAAIAATTAFNRGIQIAHVEAGLRTGSLSEPFPEEGNRRLISAIATLHFAPTMKARDNLLSENISEKSIFVTGNTVIDALFEMKTLIKQNKVIAAQLQRQFAFLCEDRDIVLVTAHRRENLGAKLENICKAVRTFAKHNPLIDIIFPVHLNPKVQTTVHSLLGNLPNIKLTAPLNYSGFVYLLDKAKLVMTDSGGLQEEAPSIGVPVVVFRDVTERPEATLSEYVRLSGTDVNQILVSATELLNLKLQKKLGPPVKTFGYGNASEKILTKLKALI